MSITAFSGLVLGMEIKLDELFTSKVVNCECVNGHKHPIGTDAMFCPKCGGKIREEVEHVLRPELGLSDLSYDDILEEDLGGFGFYQVNPRQGGLEESEIMYAYGDKIFKVSQYGDGFTDPIDLENVEQLKDKIEKQAKKYNLPLRPIKLYPYLYLG